MRPVARQHEPSPHGVQRHIARRVHQMLLVERHRAEPPLKQMSGLARAGVDEAGVEPAPSDRPAPSRRRLRRQDEMDVPASGDRLETSTAKAAAGYPEPVAVDRIIARREYDVARPAARLCHVMRQAGSDGERSVVTRVANVAYGRSSDGLPGTRQPRKLDSSAQQFGSRAPRRTACSGVLRWLCKTCILHRNAL